MLPLGLRTPRRANCPALKRKPGSRVQRRLNRVGDQGRTSSRCWRVNFSALAVILRSPFVMLATEAVGSLLDTPFRPRQTPPVCMPILTSPFASLDLVRQPEQPNEPLQAFDAADEYLLGQLQADAL